MYPYTRSETPDITKTKFHKQYFTKYNKLTVASVYIFESCYFVKNHPQYFVKVADIPRKYPLRFPHKLKINKSRLQMQSTGPKSMAIKIYNKLPDKLKSIEKLQSFIKDLKAFLINKCYYSVDDYLNDSSLHICIPHQAVPVTGKFYAYHDQVMSETEEQTKKVDNYQFNVTQSRAKGPHSKYTAPATENQVYGWYITPLVPIDRSDRRFYTPQRESAHTKIEVIIRQCNPKSKKG